MSYIDTLPTDKDRVRAILGDTSDPELLTDGHINAILGTEDSVSGAVAFLAYELVARYINEPVKVTLDGETEDYTGRLAAWSALASRNATAAQPNGGGVLSFVPVTYGRADTSDEYSRGPWWR